MATFSFKIIKNYGLIHWKESDEIHSLKIQRIEVSVCFMGHKDEINVAFALRKPTAHHGGWYTHFIKGMRNTRRGAGAVSIRCQCYGNLDLFVTCIGHLRRNLRVTWAASFYYILLSIAVMKGTSASLRTHSWFMTELGLEIRSPCS